MENISTREKKRLSSSIKYFKQLKESLKAQNLLFSKEDAQSVKENSFDALFTSLSESSDKEEIEQLSVQLISASYSLVLNSLEDRDYSSAVEYLDEILKLRNLLPRPFPEETEKLYREAERTIFEYQKIAVILELSQSRDILIQIDKISEKYSGYPAQTHENHENLENTPEGKILVKDQRVSELWKEYFFILWNSRYSSACLPEYKEQYKKYSQTFDLKEFPPDPIPMSFVAGDGFLMGSPLPSDPPEEKPAHIVYLSSFYMAQFEVTQELYMSITGQNFSFKNREQQAPVENVNWYDAIFFCNLLSQKYGLDACYDLQTKECDFTKNGFRLPTEAEWEFAAKGGIKGGNFLYSGGDDIDNLGWYSGNSKSNTYNVGKKRPNALNLYDMTGNLWEWCYDWFDLYPRSGDTLFNPSGPKEGTVKVRRGGSWLSEAKKCRNTSRIFFTPGVGYESIGLRVVRNVTDSSDRKNGE